MRRYPAPRGSGRPLNPESLGALQNLFTVTAHEYFKIGLPLEFPFYVDYMMTETNVANAVENGCPAGEIRSWCERELAPLFGDQAHEVLFRGYIGYMTLS